MIGETQVTAEQVQVKYAGFWIRVLAAILDALVMIIPVGIYVYGFIYLKNIPLTLLAYFPMLIYKPIMEWKFGATLGKIAVDIKVVNAQGLGISLGQALLRDGLLLLSALVGLYALFATVMDPLYAETDGFMAMAQLLEQNSLGSLDSIFNLLFLISAIVVAFHPQKRGLHDLVAGTFCVKKTLYE